MDTERRRIAKLGREYRRQIGRDLTLFLIGARCVYAVAICRRGRSAGKVVVLVGRDDEERIAFRDAVLGEPGKKLAKGLVINLQLLDIARFAWPKGLFGCRKRNTRESGAAVVVGVRNIAIDYRHARLEHRRKVTQCLRRRRAEPRKPWVGWTGVIGDNIAVEVRNRPSRGDLRLYIDVAKERGEAGVTTRLVVQRVGSAVGCGT